MPLLKDTCALAAAILDGDHDADLAYVRQAVAAREQHVRAASGIRKGARIRVTEGKLAGREGAVEKVNTKTVSIRLDPEPGKVHPPDEDAAYDSVPFGDIDWHTDWRVAPGILEAV